MSQTPLTRSKLVQIFWQLKSRLASSRPIERAASQFSYLFRHRLGFRSPPAASDVRSALSIGPEASQTQRGHDNTPAKHSREERAASAATAIPPRALDTLEPPCLTLKIPSVRAVSFARIAGEYRASQYRRSFLRSAPFLFCSRK